MLKNASLGLTSFLVACSLAPEAPQNGGGQSQSQVVNVYNDDTGDDTDTDGHTGDTDSGGDTSETGETGDSDTDSGIDSGDSGDTGDTAIDTGDTAVDTGDSGGDTAETGLDTAGETGIVDSGGDTSGDTASDTGDSGETGDTGGADTSTDTAADTADTGSDPVVPWYRDADGDSYGDDDVVVVDSTGPSGYVLVGGDCDDTDATVNPDAVEYPVNGIDENCSGDDAALLITIFHGETTVDGDSIASNYDVFTWYGASEEGVQNVSYSSSDLPVITDSSDTVDITVYFEDVDSTWGGHPWIETALVWDSNGDGVEETWLDEGCEGWDFTVSATEASASVGTAYAYNWTDGSGVAYGNCSLYLEGSTPSGSDVGQVLEFSVP